MANPGDDLPAFRASDDDRDAVLTILGEAMANGRLSPDEFDDRQNRALSARLQTELPDLVRDLPEGQTFLRRSPGSPSSALAPRGASGEIAPARPGHGAVSHSVAIMGGKTVTVPAGTPKVSSYLLMGGDDVYLGQVMGPGVELTVETWGMMAGSTIYVPPGVRVVDETINIMGGNDIRRGAQGDGSNGTLILKGLNFMAGNDVKLDKKWQAPED